MISYCYKILHMPRQHSCRAMCKILWWSLHYNLGDSRMKFPSNLNYKFFVKRTPWQLKTNALPLTWYPVMLSYHNYCLVSPVALHVSSMLNKWTCSILHVELLWSPAVNPPDSQIDNPSFVSEVSRCASTGICANIGWHTNRVVYHVQIRGISMYCPYKLYWIKASSHKFKT